MTPKMIQNEQQRLGAKEQKIAQQRDMALASIQEDQMRLQQSFGERVKNILEELQEEKGYDYILNEGGGGGVLVARDSYDITDEVLLKRAFTLYGEHTPKPTTSSSATHYTLQTTNFPKGTPSSVLKLLLGRLHTVRSRKTRTPGHNRGPDYVTLPRLHGAADRLRHS